MRKKNVDNFIDTQKLNEKEEITIDTTNLERKIKAKSGSEFEKICEEEKLLKENFDKLEKDPETEIENNPKIIKGSFKTNWIYRPAKIQEFDGQEEQAYKERDEEYNIW